MNVKRIVLLVAVLVLVAFGTAWGEPVKRSGYSYIRELSGDVTVESRWNGTVEARRNMPISAGDEMVTGERGRAEVSLADGSVLHVDAGTRVRFLRLKDQQGEEDDFSAIDLTVGSVVLAAARSDESATPRIDTEAATVYLSAGSRARVNADPRRGTVVVTRAGSVEVHTRAGSYTVRAGSYLTVDADNEPEVARGSFSRDRFDIWSADRFDVAADAHSASSRYVDEGYESDVVALDGYGDWSYNNTYSTNVWSPRVNAGWSPYSYGSWYYTPAGLTWWSYDPWGWYPFHYGNWFFDARWNRWCWAPASVYSPAWVYWGFTGSYVGWCPIGWYSGFYSPWWDNYYRSWNGTGRAGVYFSVHGTFPTRTVDLRGWNFTGSGGFGATHGRLDVIPGSRIGDRLGSSVAISSRTITVPAREGGGREAVQGFVREAPRTIERTANTDSIRLAPVLARQRDLPPATTDALRERAVLPVRGRLEGPGVDDLAPRGAAVNRRAVSGETRGRDRDIVTPDRSRVGTDSSPREAPPAARPIERPAAQPPADDNWRGRSRAPSGEPPASVAAPSETRPPAANRPTADWRSRQREVPPARRVIEGAVPGHRPDARGDYPARERDSRPADVRPQTRERSEYAPPPRIEPRPAAAPAPAQQPRNERAAPAPPPARAPAPAVQSAPPPAHVAPPSAAHVAPPPAQSAPPAPHAERGRKD
ncbi:MAG: DUF6600 domain-containing protein [Thermoanaerobaculia bacterium]